MADNLVRICELQPALDHVARARRTQALHFRPFTGHLAPEAEAIQERSRLADASETLAPEVDYLPHLRRRLPRICPASAASDLIPPRKR